MAQHRPSNFSLNLKTWNIPQTKISPYLDSFFQLASSKKINLIGIFTPLTRDFYTSIDKKFLINLENQFKSLSFKYSTDSKLFNYGNLPMNSDNSFFYNHLHLNYLGTDSFMNVLLKDTIFIAEFKPPL